MDRSDLNSVIFKHVLSEDLLSKNPFAVHQNFHEFHTFARSWLSIGYHENRVSNDLAP